MTRAIYVNLAVKDLDQTVEFFTALGFEFNPQFSDPRCACMVINDDAAVMLLDEDRFQDFTKKAICDSTAHTEAILCLSAGSRAEVDQMVEAALTAGGKPGNDAMEEGPMYGASFQDLDGHLWEVLYMDPSALGE